MKRKDLDAFIERVVGKKGIMRASSWWVGRLFKEVLDYSESKASSLIANNNNVLNSTYTKKIAIENVDTYTTGAVLQPNTFTKFNTPLGNISLSLAGTKEYPEYHAEIMFGEKDSSNISIEPGSLEVYWDRIDPVGKNRKCVVSIDGPIGQIIASKKIFTHYILGYLAEDTETEVKLFDEVVPTGTMYIDGVKQSKAVSSYKFDSIGEHRIDIYEDPSKTPSMSKIFRGISALTYFKVYRDGNFALDWESTFEGTAIQYPDFTEARMKNQKFVYGQMFQSCSNINLRYFNANMRNMEMYATGRTPWMFDCNIGGGDTLDLSTWDLTESYGNGTDSYPLSHIGRVLGSRKYGGSGEIGHTFYIEDRQPVAVFFDENGNPISNPNYNDTSCLASGESIVMYWEEFNTNHINTYGLPEVPEKEGYIGEWNRTAEEIKSRLSNIGYCEVGPVYTPIGEGTKFLANITEGYGLEVGVQLYSKYESGDTFTVDWGDGTETTSVTTTSTSSTTIKHTYLSEGEYEITVNSASHGYYLFYLYGYIYTENSDGTTSTTSNYYANLVITRYDSKLYAHSSYFKSEELLKMSDAETYMLVPYSDGIREYNFNSCPSATYITLPRAGGVSYEEYTLDLKMNNKDYDYMLLNISIPEGYKSIADECFHQCKYLQHIVLPSGFHTVGNRAFRYCYSMRKVVFPGSITTIGNEAFGDCFRIREYDFSKCDSSIPNIPEDAFPHISGTAVDYRIYVPDNMVSQWKNKFSHYNWVNNIIAKSSESSVKFY